MSKHLRWESHKGEKYQNGVNRMNYKTAKELLIQMQCTNKNITEEQNEALSYVISALDDLTEQYDRGNYDLEKVIIKKVYPEYSDREIEAYLHGYEEKETAVHLRILEDKTIRIGSGIK